MQRGVGLILLIGAAVCAQDPVWIPFAIGSRLEVCRSNGDAPTHTDVWNVYAFDFLTPVGTPVHAAASGTVMIVKTDALGPTGDWHDNNQIAILHEDGFAGLYEHLKKDGSAVVVGQKVLAGDLIGWSGNTGNSTDPHLHFVLRRWSGSLDVAVPGKFADVERGGVPKRGDMVVSRNYPIREIVGELADLDELYDVCANVDAREALSAELMRISKEKAPEGIRRKSLTTKGRPDLMTIYETRRTRLLERAEKDAAAAADRFFENRSGGDLDATFRAASLGARDFPFTDKGRMLQEAVEQQKKLPDAEKRESLIEPALKYRAAVTQAVKSELKARAARASGQPSSPGPVKQLFEGAARLAPTQKAREALGEHLKSPFFSAPPTMKKP